MTTTDDPHGLDVFIPLSEAAKYFGHTYTWLLSQCQSGAFPHRKVGRRYFMTAGDVKAAQDSVAVAATRTFGEPQRRPNTRGPHSFDHLLDAPTTGRLPGSTAYHALPPNMPRGTNGRKSRIR